MVFEAKEYWMPPVIDQPERSTSTAIWLRSSTHSIVGSLVAGWYMISLNTTEVSARSPRARATVRKTRKSNSLFIRIKTRTGTRLVTAGREVAFSGLERPAKLECAHPTKFHPKIQNQKSTTSKPRLNQSRPSGRVGCVSSPDRSH